MLWGRLHKEQLVQVHRRRLRHWQPSSLSLFLIQCLTRLIYECLAYPYRMDLHGDHLLCPLLPVLKPNQPTNTMSQIIDLNAQLQASISSSSTIADQIKLRITNLEASQGATPDEVAAVSTSLAMAQQLNAKLAEME